MSIEKLSATYLRHEKKPFAMILIDVLKKLTNSDALALWCHLQGMTENWVVNKQYIMNHFGWGRDKTTKALRHLEYLKLLENIKEKNPDGTFKNSVIIVKCGHDFNPCTENQSMDENVKKVNSEITENQSTVDWLSVDGLSVDGKTAPTIYNNNTLNKKYEREAPSLRAALTENFKPSINSHDLELQVSKKCSITVGDLFLKFKTIYKNKKSNDWQREWEIFLQRERPAISTSFRNNQTNEARCTVPFARPISERIKEAAERDRIEHKRRQEACGLI
jgi:hypothetical protein